MAASAGALRLRKRLLKEQQVAEDAAATQGVSLQPVEDDLTVWEARLTPVAPSLYEGGVFFVRITVSPTYPFAAPLVSTCPMSPGCAGMLRS